MKKIFIVLLIVFLFVSISLGNENEDEIDENKYTDNEYFEDNELSPNLDESDKEFLNNFKIYLEKDRELIYNITNGRHYNQIQLMENDRILGFFLDRVRDYLSEYGFDIISLEKFIKALCNTIFICKIPIIGDITYFIIDTIGMLGEAQCYRDRAENTPKTTTTTTGNNIIPGIPKIFYQDTTSGVASGTTTNTIKNPQTPKIINH